MGSAGVGIGFASTTVVEILVGDDVTIMLRYRKDGTILAEVNAPPEKKVIVRDARIVNEPRAKGKSNGVHRN